jgi:hypothetical protein
MKRTDALAAIQVCLFLLGTAWLDRAFEGYHGPRFVAEFHKPHADAPSIDDGEQEAANLMLPQLRRVPSFVTGGFNQCVEQSQPFVSKPLHTLVTILTSYEPPKAPESDDGPELVDSTIPLADALLGAIPSPGPGVSPSARHQFHVPAGDTSAPSRQAASG